MMADQNVRRIATACHQQTLRQRDALHTSLQRSTHVHAHLKGMPLHTEALKVGARARGIFGCSEMDECTPTDTFRRRKGHRIDSTEGSKDLVDVNL